MLGFSMFGGREAQTGQATQLSGLAGNGSNVSKGSTYTVSKGADLVTPAHPGHEDRVITRRWRTQSGSRLEFGSTTGKPEPEERQNLVACSDCRLAGFVD